MMIGPAPMIRIEEMSVRLGILGSRLAFAGSFRTGGNRSSASYWVKSTAERAL